MHTLFTQIVGSHSIIFCDKFARILNKGAFLSNRYDTFIPRKGLILTVV